MKKMFTENLWLKLTSVVLAALLWVLILYTYDPAATADFNLDVKIINGESITSLGKVYDVIEGNKITIRVKANSSLVKTLRSTDFEATADISKLSPTFHANIDVVCMRANNVDIRLIGKAKFLEVKLEDKISKQFPVSVEKSGEADEGFFVGNAVPKPNFITVTGGKSTINRIKVIKVKVNANKAYESFVSEATPVAYDVDGNEVVSNNLSYSQNPISVALNIFKTKTIPLVIQTVGEPYLGYGIESLHYEPKTVVLAGEDEKLKKVMRIEIPVEVTGEITGVENSDRIIDFIPDGLYLVDPDSVVNYNCKIVRFSTKDILIPKELITLNHKNDKFFYEYLESGVVKVTVRGLKNDLSKVNVETLKPEIDLKDIVEDGEYSPEIQFAKMEGVMFQTPVNVTIIVKNKEEILPPKEVNPEESENGTEEESGAENEGGEPSLPPTDGLPQPNTEEEQDGNEASQGETLPNENAEGNGGSV